MRVLDHEQLSEAWFDARRGLITASHLDAVLARGRGHGEAATRKQYRVRLIVERITGLVTENGFVSDAMRRGLEQEKFARAQFEVNTGLDVDEVGLCLHDTLPLGASPDGLIGDTGGLEIKSPLSQTHFTYLEEGVAAIPRGYHLQIQCALLVTGREWWKLASYNPNFPEHLKLLVFDFERDEDRIAEIKKGVLELETEIQAAVKRYQYVAE